MSECEPEKEKIAEEQKHKCVLSPEDLNAIKTVSSFIKRCRDAAGNIVMVMIAVLGMLALSVIILLISGGKINLFKLVTG